MNDLIKSDIQTLISIYNLHSLAGARNRNETDYERGYTAALEDMLALLASQVNAEVIEQYNQGTFRHYKKLEIKYN